MKKILNDIIKEIIEDIKDRRGLKGVWNSIDEDIQEEIKCVWANIISDKIDMRNYVNINDLILWLEGEKYGYYLDDNQTWVNYGDMNDTFPYDESNKQWELSRNRMIDKIINLLKYEDVSEVVKDYKNN